MKKLMLLAIGLGLAGLVVLIACSKNPTAPDGPIAVPTSLRPIATATPPPYHATATATPTATLVITPTATVTPVLATGFNQDFEPGNGTTGDYFSKDPFSVTVDFTTTDYNSGTRALQLSPNGVGQAVIIYPSTNGLVDLSIHTILQVAMYDSLGGRALNVVLHYSDGTEEASNAVYSGNQLLNSGTPSAWENDTISLGTGAFPSIATKYVTYIKLVVTSSDTNDLYLDDVSTY